MLFLWCFDSPYPFNFTVAPAVLHFNYPSAAPTTPRFALSSGIGGTRPVLVAEIKDDNWAGRADLRAKAADRMRQWFNAVLPDCRLPRVYGLSLLGTCLRVYVGNVATGEVEPAFATCPSPGRTLPDDFLEGAWNIDMMRGSPR